MNASGAVLFEAALTDGRSGEYLATPNPSGVPSLGPGGLGALTVVLAATGAIGSRRALTRTCQPRGMLPRTRSAFAS